VGPLYSSFPLFSPVAGQNSPRPPGTNTSTPGRKLFSSHFLNLIFVSTVFYQGEGYLVAFSGERRVWFAGARLLVGGILCWLDLCVPAFRSIGEREWEGKGFHLLARLHFAEQAV